MILRLFYQVLTEFRYGECVAGECFDDIIFAVLDKTEEQKYIKSFHIKDVTHEESIYEDIHGNKVYYVNRKLPTFDVYDRMYGSREEQYLMYDGKSVHLISVYSGYQMGTINFYQNLITADAELLPYFEMLEWPIRQVVWNKKGDT